MPLIPPPQPRDDLIWQNQLNTNVYNPPNNLNNIYLGPPPGGWIMDGIAGPTSTRQEKRPAKPSVFRRKLAEVPLPALAEGNFPDGVFYAPGNAEHLIEALGNLCPMHSRRPKYFALCLLQAAAAPMKATSGTAIAIFHDGAQRGLVTMHLPIPRKRRRSYRLSLAGIELLEHWAKKWPSFKPHLDAYLTEEARREIALECVDFALGTLPAVFEDDMKAIDAFYDREAKRKIAAQAAQIEAEQERTKHSFYKKLHAGVRGMWTSSRNQL